MSTSLEPGTVKRALSAHAAIGLVAGALLYLVSLTGTISVFYEELQRVEQPGAPEMARIDPDAVQRGVEAMLASEAGKPPTTHLFVHMPTAGLPRATAITDTQARHLNAEGSLAEPEEIAWSDFLVQLHYLLNLPSLVGITIVGVLGVMMLALALSGVVAHPRVFRDAFRLRARDKGGIGLADWHNRLSVWTLPFSITIALTGSVIGLGTITAYGIASASYDGDTEAVYAPIFGGEPEPDKRSAPVPDVAAALRYMTANHPDVALTYVVLHDPMTAGQRVQLIGPHQRRLIFGEYYAFDAKGRFHGTAGLSDGAIGQQAAASIYGLHFGNYGGLWVKIAYGVFGLALTAVSATGVYIWLGKRRRRGHAEPVLRAAWDGVVWGAPVMIALTFAARILFGNEAPFVAMFWIGYGTIIGASILRTRRRFAAPDRLVAQG
ncbi:hypothetical protein GCM10011494_21180 [Novosphingobium endophyticum]|uniref:PepSY domain-containing protein n=1 Tax=Novosphingobium endophyticum TaxID=1955250 RepID=A0A916TSI9_9SPHN|nr:PepSY-associated TM helix domain-containing protein [Novosphingobium endophyticum]GGC02369.1 hypothetical protein GCM10011494_21180 [Novosphingobium endophyticum]